MIQGVASLNSQLLALIISSKAYPPIFVHRLQ
jgi:hypothetical protein